MDIILCPDPSWNPGTKNPLPGDGELLWDLVRRRLTPFLMVTGGVDVALG